MKKAEAKHVEASLNKSNDHFSKYRKMFIGLFHLVFFVLIQFFCFANPKPTGSAIYTSTCNPSEKPKQDSSFSIDDQDFGTFTDARDGKTYKTIKIGKQTWMAENLAYKTKDGIWAYDNKESNVQKYGYLYTWEAAKQACPSGWHLPSDEEWRQLEMFLGMAKADTGLSGFRSDIGWKLKKTSGWHSKQKENGTVGFEALPAGLYSFEDSTFNDIEYNAYFWTDTSPKAEFVWERDLFDTFNEISRNRYKKTYGFSVRCIKD